MEVARGAWSSLGRVTSPRGGGLGIWCGEFLRVNKDRKDLRAAQMVIDKRPEFKNRRSARSAMAVGSLLLAVILVFSKSSGGRHESGLTNKSLSCPTSKREVINLNSGFLTQRKQERIHGASI